MLSSLITPRKSRRVSGKQNTSIAQLELARNDIQTYSKPLHPQNRRESKHIQKFISQFSRTIGDRTSEIIGILETHPNSVGKYYDQLVTNEKRLTYEEFWQRYFYRCGDSIADDIQTGKGMKNKSVSVRYMRSSSSVNISDLANKTESVSTTSVSPKKSSNNTVSPNRRTPTKSSLRRGHRSQSVPDLLMLNLQEGSASDELNTSTGRANEVELEPRAFTFSPKDGDDLSGESISSQVVDISSEPGLDFDGSTPEEEGLHVDSTFSNEPVIDKASESTSDSPDQNEEAKKNVAVVDQQNETVSPVFQAGETKTLDEESCALAPAENENVSTLDDNNEGLQKEAEPIVPNAGNNEHKLTAKEEINTVNENDVKNDVETSDDDMNNGGSEGVEVDFKTKDVDAMRKEREVDASQNISVGEESVETQETSSASSKQSSDDIITSLPVTKIKNFDQCETLEIKVETESVADSQVIDADKSIERSKELKDATKMNDVQCDPELVDSDVDRSKDTDADLEQGGIRDSALGVEKKMREKVDIGCEFSEEEKKSDEDDINEEFTSSEKLYAEGTEEKNLTKEAEFFLPSPVKKEKSITKSIDEAEETSVSWWHRGSIFMTTVIFTLLFVVALCNRNAQVVSDHLDGLCSPVKPGTVLSSGVDATFISPWWASDEYKSVAFNLCGSRPQARLEWMVQGRRKRYNRLSLDYLKSNKDLDQPRTFDNLKKAEFSLQSIKMTTKKDQVTKMNADWVAAV